MKMLKQRFRERSESWLSASTDRFLVHPPHPPLVEPHNPPVSILSHSSAQTATTAATNGQSNLSTLPVIELNPPLNPAGSNLLSQNSPQLPQQQHQQDRPRKKLSFRDPEVTSAEASGKDGDASSSHQQPHNHQHLGLLKDQGFSDSMENVDLEVLLPSLSIHFKFREGRRRFCSEKSAIGPLVLLLGQNWMGFYVTQGGKRKSKGVKRRMFILVYVYRRVYIYINLPCCLLSNIFFFLHIGKQGNAFGPPRLFLTRGG
jgi:hypothetical protein